MTEDQIRELMRDMRDEPLPPDSLARVRAGVGAKLARRNWFGWAWKLGIPGAIAAGLLVYFQVHVVAPPALTGGAKTTTASTEIAPISAPPVRAGGTSRQRPILNRPHKRSE